MELWKTNRRYIIALPSYTVSISRVKLHDIHYLLLVNDSPGRGSHGLNGDKIRKDEHKK